MKLKEIRTMSGLSQKALGDQLGLKDTTISKYERGASDPTIETLIKLADIFGVSVDALVGHNGNLLDLNSVSSNQRKLIELISTKLTDEEVAQLLGYSENIIEKRKK